MKIKVLFLLLIALLSFSACCHVSRSRVKFTSLGVESFERIIQQDDVYLVDVRTAEEHAKGSIEGTDENLDVKGATFFSDFKRLPKDKTVAVYCKGGGRSKQVAGVLAGNGYKVVELATGYDGWVKHHQK